MGCRTIQFSPSSPLLALGGYDNCVRLYNTLTWKEQSIHPHEQSALLDNAVCPLLPSWTPRRPLMLRWTSLICLNPTAVHSVKSSKLSWYILSFSSRFYGFLGKNAWFFLFLCLSRPGQSYRQTIESIVFFILFLLCFRSQDNKLGVHFLSWSPDGKYIVFEPSDWLIVHRRVERRACPRLCGSGTPLAVVCTPFCYSRTPSLPSLGVLAHCFWPSSPTRICSTSGDLMESAGYRCLKVWSPLSPCDF